jgi:rhamnogalacturonan endolyase
MRMARGIIIFVVFGWVAAWARANVAGGGSSGPDVTITPRGNEVVLANGILTVSVDPENATITGIRYMGHDMVSTSGRHHTVYFSRDGGTDYEQLPNCTGSIVTNTPDMAEVSCKHIWKAGEKHPYDVDVHFILRRGASGVYVFADVSHPADYPEMNVGEWRMVWSTPDDARNCLEDIYVDNLRHWLAPTPMEMSHNQVVPNAPKEVTLVTGGPWAGRLDCKYMYAAQYWDLGCWGFASDEKNMGEWVVFGSHEFFNDGPNKQDLTAASGTTLVHLNMNHYDGTGFSIPQGQAWEKFYGPWMLYMNHEPGGDACWEDAREQATAETAAWPYSWLKSANYPPAVQRGRVEGKFIVKDPLKPGLNSAGAWVGLAAPESGPKSDFQFQSTGYQYWVHAGADGKFSIPAVRPGNYELYAYVTGAVGQFGQSGVTVRPGDVTSLGDVTWDVPHPGKSIAWEIGVPDRSAGEFVHGNDYYLPLLYQRLWQEVPEPLEYTVGQSDWKKDWCYAQTRHGPEKEARPAHWRIHFYLTQGIEGTATLTLAFAGANDAKLGVYVNDESTPLEVVEPEVQGGNGLVREAVHTKYSVSYVPIPGERLRAGENTISLVQGNTGQQSYIMYDYLNLELPTAGAMIGRAKPAMARVNAAPAATQAVASTRPVVHAVEPQRSPAEEFLAMAHVYLNNDRPDLARAKLQAILDQYPDDPAAAKAKEMLDGMPGN